MIFEGEGLNETKVVEYGFYANGLKSYIKNFNNNALNGKSIEWHENGNKSFEGHFKNNIKDVLHYYWFGQSTPQYSMNYLN